MEYLTNCDQSVRTRNFGPVSIANLCALTLTSLEEDKLKNNKINSSFYILCQSPVELNRYILLVLREAGLRGLMKCSSTPDTGC